MERKKILVADTTIVSEEDPKNLTTQLLWLISEMTKVTGYKLYIQKSITFFSILASL